MPSSPTGGLRGCTSLRRHTVWTDERGFLLLGVWQGGFGSPTEPGERWFVSDRGTVASVGSLRWSGRPWTPESSWAWQIDAALEGNALRDLTHELRGVFSIVTLSNSGDGEIASDPLGFNFVYHAANRELTALSSRAALCARVLADEGSRPARDHLAACWPAYSRHWIGERTGYSDVRLVRPGTVIKVTTREPPSLDVDRTPWVPAEDLCDLTRSELLDLASVGVFSTRNPSSKNPDRAMFARSPLTRAQTESELVDEELLGIGHGEKAGVPEAHS